MSDGPRRFSRQGQLGRRRPCGPRSNRLRDWLRITGRRVAARTAQSSLGTTSGASAPRSALRAVTTAVEWLTIFAIGGALYNLREWRGKGRRYRDQRRRVANELLRADFRRSSRF